MDHQKNQAPEKGLALDALAITFGFIWALGGRNQIWGMC